MTDTPKTDTPESNKAKIAFTSLFAGDDAYWVPFIVARKLERERDELRAQLREEQQLHIQTLDERDQWRNEHDRVVHEYQHRMMVIGMSVIEATHYPENVPVVAPATLEPESKNDVVAGCPPTTCCASSFVLEQRFKPGWYLEWWGDGEGGPYWTNDLAKAEKLTMDRAKYEKGMLREETLIIPHNDKIQP